MINILIRARKEWMMKHIALLIGVVLLLGVLATPVLGNNIQPDSTGIVVVYDADYVNLLRYSLLNANDCILDYCEHLIRLSDRTYDAELAEIYLDMVLALSELAGTNLEILRDESGRIEIEREE